MKEQGRGNTSCVKDVEVWKKLWPKKCPGCKSCVTEEPKAGYYAVPDFRCNGIVSHNQSEKWYAFWGLRK